MDSTMYPLDLRKIVRNIELTNICGKKFAFSIKEIIKGECIDDPGSPINSPNSSKFSQESPEKYNKADGNRNPVNSSEFANFPGEIVEKKYDNNNRGSLICPPGLRKIWPDIELKNSRGNEFYFSIQNIPKNRYSEVLDFMSTYFINKESMQSSMKNDMNILRDVWRTILEKDISIAAFVKKKNQNDYYALAAVDLLLLMDVTSRENKCNNNNVSNKRITNMFGFISVHPNFRGLGLGKILLEIRNEIDREYGTPDLLEFEEILESPLEDDTTDEDDDE